jgi:uncharacterized protein YcfJ
MNKLMFALVGAFALAACTDPGSVSGFGDPASRAGQPLDSGDALSGSVTRAPDPNCYEVQVSQPVEPRDDKKIAGTAIGAAVGGAIGKEVGDDDDLTTAAGAAAGAFAGHVAQDRYQDQRTETVTELRCD